MRRLSTVLCILCLLVLISGSAWAQLEREICPGSPLDCIQDLSGGVNVRTRICRLRVQRQYHSGTIVWVYGTGVLVDCGDGKKDKVLTAKHLVKGADSNGRYGTLDFKADFGYYHPGPAGSCDPNSTCGEIPETRNRKSGVCHHTSGLYDVALLLLDQEATTADPPLQISAGVEPGNDVDLYIPQHPLGDCMEVAEGRIDHYGIGETPEVYYNISVVNGSSGAPIIRKSDGRIVGLVTAELQDCPNVGVRLNKLREVVPQLCAQRMEEGLVEELCIINVSTLSEFGLFVLLALLILSAIYVIYQRRKGVARA